MGHPDQESLAALALGEPVAADVRNHVEGCPACRSTVADLSGLAGLARSARDETLVEPPPEVWLGVAAQLESPVTAPQPTPRRRTTAWLVAAAVVAALGVGAAGGWALGHRDSGHRTDVVATTALTSLQGDRSRGDAQVLWTPGHTSLQVDASRLPTSGEDLHEVWLLDQDGHRMVALGLLSGADRGTFAVPQRLLDEGYRTVDISLEPDDGNPAHSGVSIARGTLTSS